MDMGFVVCAKGDEITWLVISLTEGCPFQKQDSKQGG